MSAWLKRAIFGMIVGFVGLMGLLGAVKYKIYLGTNTNEEVLVILLIIGSITVGVVGAYYLVSGLGEGGIKHGYPRTPKFLSSFNGWLNRDGVK